MTWREERRLLNACLTKHNLVSKRAGHIIHQKARTIRKRKRVEANRKWRKRHYFKYVAILRNQKKARASKQQESPSPRFARIRAQHAVIEAFFLCPK